MIKIECPACQKIQPEADLMIQDTLKQRCNFCGATFEVDIAANAFVGNEKIGGKLISKGLLDQGDQGFTAYRIDPTVRNVFGIALIFIGLIAIVVSKGGSTVPHLPLILLFICALTGTFAGMLAGKTGYSEILTPGAAGVIAGLLVGMMYTLIIPGEQAELIRKASSLFGVYSIGSFAGGLIAWSLRKFFKISLGGSVK